MLLFPRGKKLTTFSTQKHFPLGSFYRIIFLAFNKNFPDYSLISLKTFDVMKWGNKHIQQEYLRYRECKLWRLVTCMDFFIIFGWNLTYVVFGTFLLSILFRNTRSHTVGISIGISETLTSVSSGILSIDRFVINRNSPSGDTKANSKDP